MKRGEERVIFLVNKRFLWGQNCSLYRVLMVLDAR